MRLTTGVEHDNTAALLYVTLSGFSDEQTKRERPLHCIIFDIDGILTQSTGFDAACFKEAVLEHMDVSFKDDWGEYVHVTDSGILNEIVVSHGLQQHEAELTRRVKASFIARIEAHLQKNPVREVPGANAFITHLRDYEHVCLGIATGGWGETAIAKLNSAGIATKGLPLVSANDALSRVDIMNIALARVKQGNTVLEPISNNVSITYFGDASWDKKACAELNWNLVVVGDRTEHHQRINDYYQVAALNEYLEFMRLQFG